jgi:nicotinamidase-related amidase
LERGSTGLLVVDVQEKLMSLIDSDALESRLCLLIEAARVLDIPIVVTEQNPLGLGSTVECVRKVLSEEEGISEKRTFSCVADRAIETRLRALPVQDWIVAGIETHVCVLQTAKELLLAGAGVAIASDAVGARNRDEHLGALDEMRHFGARVSSVETLLFELMRTSESPQFKEVSALVKGA